jgi:hypothetical protein
MEIHNVYWREKAGTQATEVRKPVPNHFFTYDHVTYENFLKIINLHTLHNRRLTLGALFFYFCLFRVKMLPV